MTKHVSAQRVADSKELNLWRKIKGPVKMVLMLSKGTDHSNVDLFRYCYPNLWSSVCAFHADLLMHNASRIKKGKKSIYTFKTANDYLASKINSKGLKPASLDKPLTIDEKEEKIESLHQQNNSKLKTTKAKTAIRERYKQHVAPSYVTAHTKLYYHWRKRYPEDIDTRYLVIHELAKYKCKETIRFLESLVRCEKNKPLQHYAWECLNSLGVTGVHKGRRQGKKKYTYTKGFTPVDSPSGLLKLIYNSPLEEMKHYDLFLSHSYKDKDSLIDLKDKLNATGLNVYMDWVNDKDELSRDKTCADTATVITERIKNSKAILYVHTDSSASSKWTPWELGFAYAIGKPVLVYRPAITENEPEYLQLYGDVEVKDNQLMVNQKPLYDWVKTIK